MGAVYDECAADIERWKQEFAGRPRDEMIQLWMLALERESIVSVTYREDLIQNRLEKLPLSNDVRELISHALLWAWKDEEMHAIYIRGALFRYTTLLGKIKIVAQEASGLIGGWASSVQQNLLWREAPVSRLLASALTLSGMLVGKVSAAVRGQLRYHSFFEFCQFNVDAEKTAVLVWSRLLELVQEYPELKTADFAQMKEDESKHAKVFALFAEALTPEDTLQEGASVDALIAGLREIDEFFLPPRHRTDFTTQKFSESAPVFVMRGTEKRALMRSLLEALPIQSMLSAHAKEPSQIVVAIKTSFMMGCHKEDLSPITDPELLDVLCDYLRGFGVSKIFVLEATNHFDRFFANRSIEEVAHYFGLTSEKYKIIDALQDQVEHLFQRGMAQYTISETWQDADLRITFGKMRTHPTNMMHLTMRNMEGLSARSEEFLFADRQAQLDTALMALLHDFPPDLALLDAFDHVADGVAGILGTSSPLHPKRLYGSEDALALDIVAMRHCHFKRPLEVGTMREARQWFGSISENSPVYGENALMSKFRHPRSNGFFALLSALAFPVYSLASGRGFLFVPEMDTAAFPPKQNETSAEAFLRSCIRRMLGLRRARVSASTRVAPWQSAQR
jgi:uncharacterized protein (DUF362 family)